VDAKNADFIRPLTWGDNGIRWDGELRVENTQPVVGMSIGQRI